MKLLFLLVAVLCFFHKAYNQKDEWDISRVNNTVVQDSIREQTYILSNGAVTGYAPDVIDICTCGKKGKFRGKRFHKFETGSKLKDLSIYSEFRPEFDNYVITAVTLKYHAGKEEFLFGKIPDTSTHCSSPLDRKMPQVKWADSFYVCSNRKKRVYRFRWKLKHDDAIVLCEYPRVVITKPTEPTSDTDKQSERPYWAHYAQVVFGILKNNTQPDPKNAWGWAGAHGVDLKNQDIISDTISNIPIEEQYMQCVGASEVLKMSDGRPVGVVGKYDEKNKMVSQLNLLYVASGKNAGDSSGQLGGTGNVTPHFLTLLYGLLTALVLKYSSQ